MNKEKRWDKIFREPGRAGGTRKEKSRVVRARQQSLMNSERYEELPSKQGMKDSPPKTKKYFSKREITNQGPLKKWIQSVVGTHVDDALSQLMESIPSNDAPHRQEILRRLKFLWTEAHEVYLINNIPHEISLWGKNRGKMIPLYSTIYVHPDTGIITRSPSAPVSKNKKRMPRSVTWNNICYTSDERGNWYKTIQVGSRLSNVIVDKFKVPDDNSLRGWSWAYAYDQVYSPHMVTHQIDTKEKARLLDWWESTNNPL